MSTTITEKIIQLRKEAGFSQAEVAQRIGVSRSTYSNYETGATEPRLSEISALSGLYEISLDDLVSDTETSELHIEFTPIIAKQPEQPRFNPDKFREVLLYVIEQVGARANIGETALYKLLYFIDTDYYEQYGRSITGLRYVKQKYGPTPLQAEFTPAINSLKERGELVTHKVKAGKYAQKKYLPTIEVQLAHLSAHELEHINKELARLATLNASELSRLSHQDTPWIATKTGGEISYTLVMYRTALTRTRELCDDL